MHKHKDIRIYFYSPSPLKNSYEKTQGVRAFDYLHGQTRVFLNTVPVYLDSYIKRTDTAFYSQVTWTKVDLLFKTQDELIKDILRTKSNVLCFSLYIWNNEHTLQIISGLKAKLSDVTIIVGGPSVGIIRNNNYLNENPDVDYAVFAQGEKPFYDILKCISTGSKLSLLTTKNCAWIDKSKGKLQKADHEFHKLTNGSPYIESQHILRQIVSDPQYRGYQFELPYETAKGCPYNCSFCDWTSGLSNKVSKRVATYELELELFASLGIFKFYLSDANFGIHKEDFSVVNAVIKLKTEKGYPFKFFAINFSKVKKDAVYKIADLMLQYDLLDYFKCSIQDMHQDILDNIDRPDVPWPEQLEYLRDLMRKHPGTIPSIEVIQGLPGQTRESWENMLFEMSSHGFHMNIYKFMIIPNSPAGYDLDWNRRMQIKTGQLYLDETHSDEYVLGTFSYDLEDYAYFSFISEIFLILEHSKFKQTDIFKRLVCYIKSRPEFSILMNLATKLVTYTPDFFILVQWYYNNVIVKFLKDNADINKSEDKKQILKTISPMGKLSNTKVYSLIISEMKNIF